MDHLRVGGESEKLATRPEMRVASRALDALHPF
jgi:hypothetical protein